METSERCSVMAIKYTEEQLNTIDKSLLIQMFLGMQEELSSVNEEMHRMSEEMSGMDQKMQLLMEQVILGNKARFGRSSEKMPDTDQISFLEAASR